MSLSETLAEEVEKIFRESWETTEGRKVPDAADVKLSNHGVKIDVAILYADLAESTDLVDKYDPRFAAEVYKTYLHCAVKVIRQNGGSIESFDGDRVMGVFFGDSKNTSAATAALQINYVVRNIINPALKAQYPNSDYVLNAACGVDSGNVLVARTGIRNNNDLVWVGPSANYAAKLCSLREDGFSTWITERVFNSLNESAKYGGQPRELMWEKRTWTKYSTTVYRSGWWWKP